jgi:hypothetical protein
MNLVWGFLIIVGADAVAIGAMLLVRRRAPDGSYFTNGDRAAGVFGVIAGGFAIFAGFVIFLAFTVYDNSRSGAEAEALTVTQQYETAQFLPVAVRGRLSGELICYGRSVVHQEWPNMEQGRSGETINPWEARLFKTLELAKPTSDRAIGVRQVARPDLRPRDGEARPASRSVWSHSVLALGRAVPHRRNRLRVHAVLRGQRRAQRVAGDAHRLGHYGGRGHAAGDQRLEQSVPARRGKYPARGDGAHAPRPRPGPYCCGRPLPASLRHEWRSGPVVTHAPSSRVFVRLVSRRRQDAHRTLRVEHDKLRWFQVIAFDLRHSLRIRGRG